ncbi:hypothetical protein TW81_17295 [Vibrio galatheae]|uniref:Beta-ketoacyl synthase N-terminal domain-containing protein n=1 Tax=Vibrio galatheae TaxID=579748 RepID=A0A0F4NEX9_9VIBR|nr:hypothetical protein [Vibrio galatheae]KJY81665.1 hypothetical protein TW81_17295 [Vibrio galatheae]
MYIHQISSYYTHRNSVVDIKQVCKKVAPNYIRRTDRFIQLGILGVSDITDLASHTALYLVSGQGDLAVFNRSCEQRYIDKTPPKPVDFINSLSNTAGFYLSKYLGLDSENLNLSHHGFVVENALRLAQAKLNLERDKQILLGGIDECPDDMTSPLNYLGLSDEVQIGEGSSWLLLNQEQSGALARIVDVSATMSLDGLKHYLDSVDEPCYVAISDRIDDSLHSDIHKHTQLELLDIECDFYETKSLYVINQFIASKRGTLRHINYIDGKYCVMVIKTLT